MPRKGLPLHANDAISLYCSGLSVPKVSQQTGIPASTIYCWVRKAGVRKPLGLFNAEHGRNRRSVIQDRVTSMFNDGRSVKAIAAELGVSRRKVVLTLADAGLTPRTRSEGMFARMAMTSTDSRKELAAAANAARRNTRASAIELHRKAIRKCETGSKIGKAETELVRALHKRGIDSVPQHPIGPYNIDVMCGDVAVEVHSQSCWPHQTTAYRKRIEYLLDCGLNVVYVLCRTGGGTLPATNACTHEIVAFIERTDRDPTFRREYRMIRRTGELVAAARDNLDNLPLKPMSRRRKNSA